MSYLFEHLATRLEERAKEKAEGRLAPRETAPLTANLVRTGEADACRPGVRRTLNDPACGTEGAHPESEKPALSRNERARHALFGHIGPGLPRDVRGALPCR